MFLGFVDDGFLEVICFLDLLNIFFLVIISEYNDVFSCVNNVMDGCFFKIEMVFIYDFFCMIVYKFFGKFVVIFIVLKKGYYMRKVKLY